MKAQPQTRRMFLQGAGGVLLAIPFLPSLSWRLSRARAQDPEPPVRYIQWITNHGQFDGSFWPSEAHAPVEPAIVAGDAIADAKVRPLSSIRGPLSLILNESFDAVRGKLNLIRGLDLMVASGYHNASVPTCASWPREDNHIPAFSHSVDSVLETSAKFYPMPVRAPALRLTPGVNSSFKWGSFCWTTQNGVPLKLPAYSDPQAALSAVFAGSENDPGMKAQAARVRLVDQVKEDYRHVSNLRALGAADKQLLSHYIDLLADVQRRAGTDISACAPPELGSATDFDVLHRNAIDLSVAAMLCGATRVVAYHCYQGSPSQYDEDTFHAWSHNNATKHAQLMVYRYKQLANLLRVMDQVTEINGKTLLDNSLVFAGNELSDPAHASGHLQNMPVLLAGGAGGRLTTGNYIDYAGRLFNNLLITIFHVLGLGPDDYQREGVIGFGDDTGANPAKYQRFLTTAERQSPLPFLYRASG